MSSTSPALNEERALACYLSVVVAIGKCIGEVCPSVGAAYRDRLLKLPRRLGFDATPQTLDQSRDAVETDLAEFTRTASAWFKAGSSHAQQLLPHITTVAETIGAAAELHIEFLQDLAEHMTASAELDDEAQIRSALKNYAAGLSAYARRSRAEKVSSLADLDHRRAELEKWLAEETTSRLVDTATGLPNRKAAEYRIETQIDKQKPFCAVLVAWTGTGSILQRLGPEGADQLIKELGERLAASIRPYDIVFRFARDQILTVFEASAEEVAPRCHQIAGWLRGEPYTVEIAGKRTKVEAQTSVTVFEYTAGETVAQFASRIESNTRHELAVR
jgi:GGDEF domain-containing protein